MQPDTDPDVRFDADFLRRANRLIEFLEFLRDDDHRFAKLPSEQRDPNKCGILIAVADDETLGVFMHRQCRDQLWLAARFQSEMKSLAGIDNFLNHFTQLIDLDRKNAAILIAITELLDRVLKHAVNRFNAVPQQILKPDYEREWQTT